MSGAAVIPQQQAKLFILSQEKAFFSSLFVREQERQQGLGSS